MRTISQTPRLVKKPISQSSGSQPDARSLMDRLTIAPLSNAAAAAAPEELTPAVCGAVVFLNTGDDKLI